MAAKKSAKGPAPRPPRKPQPTPPRKDSAKLVANKRGALVVDRDSLHKSAGYKRQVDALTELSGAMRKELKKRAEASKGAAVGSVLPVTPPRVVQRREDLMTRVRNARVERKEDNARKAGVDMFSLPDMPDLPSLDMDIAMIDPVADAESELRTFGPELDESPITEDDEELSHEQQEALRLAELHKGFRERMANEAKRRELATDTEYWCCIVFQDRDQKDQFLKRSGLIKLGDKYLDGERVAEHMGVDVDKSQIVYNIGGADPKLAALVDIDPAYTALLDATPDGTRKQSGKAKRKG